MVSHVNKILRFKIRGYPNYPQEVGQYQEFHLVDQQPPLSDGLIYFSLGWYREKREWGLLATAFPVKKHP